MKGEQMSISDLIALVPGMVIYRKGGQHYGVIEGVTTTLVHIQRVEGETIPTPHRKTDLIEKIINGELMLA